MRTKIIRWLLMLAFVSVCWLATTCVPATAQQQSAPQSSTQPAQDKNSSDTQKPAQNADEAAQSDSHRVGIAGELAKETREAEGEEEEHSDLKHSSMVQKFGKLLGLNVHQAHLAALFLNFAIIVFVIFWFARKSGPGFLRARNESIQRALEEARTASQEAGRRLGDIETRLRQMDVEISRMQASAENEAEAEEARIKKASEEEVQKIVESAKLEIAVAAKQARRELSTHTADLAITLARKQINVDSNTDQVLVRNFSAKLANTQNDGGKGGR